MNIRAIVATACAAVAIAGSAALFLHLFTAGPQQPQSTPGPVDKVVLNTPAPGDPEYVAEDPRLTQLIGQPGPAIKLQTVDGQTIDLKALYGAKPVYLKLWATYCIPCRAQMPGFEKIYETFGNHMDVIAVNGGVGDDAAKVKAFAQEYGLHMPLAIDDGALARIRANKVAGKVSVAGMPI